MVPGEIIKVVKGMLGQSQEILGLLLLEGVGLYGDAQREDGAACLEERGSAKLERGSNLEKESKGLVILTLPSAQSSMSSKGRFARYMVVVFHHIGRPRQRTINQKERMT